MFPDRVTITIPADKTPEPDRPPQLPGETFTAYRERLAPKGWRLLICKLIWTIPHTWFRKMVPCPDGREGCMVAHYGDAWLNKIWIGKGLHKLTSRWDKRPMVIFEEVGIIVINDYETARFEVPK